MSDSNGNGVIRLGRKGIRKFQLDEGDPVVEFDVVHVWNQWMEIDRSYRDENNKVPKEKISDLNARLNSFACELLQVEAMSDANALQFQAILSKEVDTLVDFFEDKPSEKQSSPGSTKLTFSE